MGEYAEEELEAEYFYGIDEDLSSKFKVGDWVYSLEYPHMKPICIKSIYESNTRKGDYGLKSNGTVFYASESELWAPKEGEWCWFWNTDEDTPLLSPYVCEKDGKFISLHGLFEESDDGEKVRGYEKCQWTHCEPFTNNIKEMKETK